MYELVEGHVYEKEYIFSAQTTLMLYLKVKNIIMHVYY